MSNQYPPQDPNWGEPTPPQNPGPGAPQPPAWGAPPQPQQPQPPAWGAPPQQPPPQQPQPPSWGTPPQPEQPAWGAPQQPPPQQPPPQQPGWGSPQQPQPPAQQGWVTPQTPAQDPSWAPPPPPSPTSRQPNQPAWGAPQQQADPYGAQQQPWSQPAYGAPAYGAFQPAPAPSRRGRLWIILGSVAAAVIVVVVAGILVVPRVLNATNSVPPATGNTVSTSFVHFKVTSSWSETQTRGSELELNNNGDGDMLVGYGNSKHDGINSDQGAFSNLLTNLRSNTGKAVTQCMSEESVTVGGKAGLEEGFRYTFQGTDLCEIAWVDYVSSSRYYYWNIADDYSHLSTLQHDNRAMQETATWKV